MNRCADCGFDNVRGTLFCEECGRELAPEPRFATGDVSAAGARVEAAPSRRADGTRFSTGDVAPAKVDHGGWLAADDEVAAEEIVRGSGALEAASGRPETRDRRGEIAARVPNSAEAHQSGPRRFERIVPVGEARVAAVPTPVGADETPRGVQPARACPASIFLEAESGRRVDVPSQEVVIVGREDMRSGIRPDVDLTLDGASAAGVSRRHCRLLQMPDGWYLEDLMSTNFTVLNGKALTAHQPVPVKDGDDLRLGKLRLKIHVA